MLNTKTPQSSADFIAGVTRFLPSEPESEPQSEPLFNIKPLAEWVENGLTKPRPKMLFGELWYERELCIFFAETNLGKSILAVQIAESIASGQPIAGIEIETEPQAVLFIDFELTETQLAARYSEQWEKGQGYKFHPNFYRAEIEIGKMPPEGLNYEQWLLLEIEAAITTRGIKTIIIDNISALRGELERAKDATILMNELNAIKKKHDISLLIIAHTPKRIANRPITRSDLQGSSNISNFADSMFALGKACSGVTHRYLKQLKTRAKTIKYTEQNVLFGYLEKVDNYLQIIFAGTQTEYELLALEQPQTDRTDRASEAKALFMQGKTKAEIARTFGVTEGAVRKWVKESEPQSDNGFNADADDYENIPF